MKFKEVKQLVYIFLFIILFGSGVYSFVEGWSYLDSLYFSVVTVTTLGYGDFVPLTNIGKIFTIIYSLSGIAVGLYFLAIIGKYIALELRKRELRIRGIKRGEEFDVSKLLINEVIEWHPEDKNVFEGIVIGISLNEIKLKLIKRNKKILPRKEQKVIRISSKGKVKRS